MNTNDLVPDLKICQEAKEKGVVINSLSYFVKEYPVKEKEVWVIARKETITGTISFYENEHCPAPLTDEILKVLPETIKRYDRLFCLRITKTAGNYFAWYEEFETDDGIDYDLYFEDKKLSNALLLLAIKLKEEGIIN